MPRKYKVLIVEDEIDLLQAIELKLTSAGFSTITSATGEDALEKLSEKPDCVWLDLFLPKMSGLDFLAEMKKNQSTRHIPVIVVSNSGGPDKMKAALELGVKDYLVKAETKLENVIDKIKLIVHERKSPTHNSTH